MGIRVVMRGAAVGAGRYSGAGFLEDGHTLLHRKKTALHPDLRQTQNGASMGAGFLLQANRFIVLRLGYEGFVSGDSGKTVVKKRMLRRFFCFGSMSLSVVQVQDPE